MPLRRRVIHTQIGMNLDQELRLSSRTLKYARARAADAVRLLRAFRPWSELATRWRAGDRVHQDNSVTWPDRYPMLFGAVQSLLDDRPLPTKLLSYGCSSGEEVTTLRRYFPHAVIVGAEINRHLLRVCRRVAGGPNILFVPSDDVALDANAPYDAIFCMAVLTRRPHEVEQGHIRDIGRFYPFEKFAGEVRRLASLLVPGGLLVVEHTLYRVEDAVSGVGLSPVLSHGFGPASGLRFAPDGGMIVPHPIVARIFRKDVP